MKKFPNAFVIILSVIILAWLLSYIIPQGSYDRELDSLAGRTQVVANSYKSIEAPHLSAFDLLLAIPKGITGRADLIVLILLLGGCFYVIEKTGAFNQGLNRMILLLKGKESLALVIITILFLAAGLTIGMQEELIAMTPILLLFGRSLGYSAAVMIYTSYGSAVVGAAFSPFNPFGVLIAQQGAELELMSGSAFRMVALGVAALVWTIYIIRYAARNRVEKSKAVLQVETLSNRSKLILALLGITFGIVTYGLIEWAWGYLEMSACFFALGLFSGLIAQFGFNKATETYVDGFKEMIFACIIIGLANSISFILSEGMVIDTIVHGLFGPLQGLSPSVSAILMMISHTILHFPIPSYSGQAILTMPILTPLSDLIGLPRQVTVLAYQYGAILMDVIVPTNGALMAIIALGGIKYNKWVSFILKPALLMLGIAAFSILIAVKIGLN